MKIIYTQHAVERMFERSLTAGDIEATILEPDGKIKQSLDKWIYYKRLKKRNDNSIAAVIVNKELNTFQVLTVMVNFEVYK